MHRFAAILLALSVTLPACSAEQDPVVEPAATAPADLAVTEGSANAPAGRDNATARDESVPVLAANTESRTPVAAPAARADIVEGEHYRVLTPAQPTSSPPDKIEVAEMFMYSCPHCYTFEPFVNKYKAEMPAHVNFVRVPASFNKMARVHAKAFYAAETLGILEDVHGDFFRAFHNERNRLANEKAVIDFFAKHGVDRAEAEKALESFAVDTKLRQADTLVRRYRIDSVPTLVVNGKYVTSGSMAGSSDKLRDIVDYLVAKEAAEL